MALQRALLSDGNRINGQRHAGVASKYSILADAAVTPSLTKP